MPKGMTRAVTYGLLYFAVALLGVSVWMISTADTQTRTAVHTEAAAQLLEAGTPDDAAAHIARAIAMNPYDIALWSQLSYAAPDLREAVIRLSSSLSRSAMLHRLQAAERLEESDLIGGEE